MQAAFARFKSGPPAPPMATPVIDPAFVPKFEMVQMVEFEVERQHVPVEGLTPASQHAFGMRASVPEPPPRVSETPATVGLLDVAARLSSAAGSGYATDAPARARCTRDPRPVVQRSREPQPSGYTVGEGTPEVQPLPWVANLELFPGAVYTGFLDRSGRPAGLGCLRYASPQAQTARNDKAADVNVVPVSRPGARWQHPPMFLVRDNAARPSVVTWASPPRGARPAVPFAVYTGQFRNGRRHGLGFMTLENGIVRAGVYVEDEQHGAGVEIR
ncbi:hypothetical protein T484DRAFT_1805916, partial [Baffinella frigidus]